MKIFTDNAGRTWTIAIHVTAVKRCRALLSVDLYGLVDEGFVGFSKLLSDPIALVDVVYVLCKDEADKLGISDEDFGRSMAGDAIERASVAFVEELTDFFPDPRVRTGLKKAIAAGRKMTDLMMEEMTTRLDGIDPEAEAKKLIGSSGNSRESSGSIPDYLLSANLQQWRRADNGPSGDEPRA
jgi:hypothetical protein